MLVECGVLLAALLGNAVWGPIAVVLAATLVIGGVLGIGLAHLWWTQRRRP